MTISARPSKRRGCPRKTTGLSRRELLVQVGVGSVSGLVVNAVTAASREIWAWVRPEQSQGVHHAVDAVGVTVTFSFGVPRVPTDPTAGRI